MATGVRTGFTRRCRGQEHKGRREPGKSGNARQKIKTEKRERERRRGGVGSHKARRPRARRAGKNGKAETGEAQKGGKKGKQKERGSEGGVASTKRQGPGHQRQQKNDRGEGAKKIKNKKEKTKQVHRRERHPRYIGSFVGFWVGIPKLSGDMKLLFFCFGLLTYVVLLLCCRLFSGAIRPIGRLPDAMETTRCAKPLPKGQFYF